MGLPFPSPGEGRCVGEQRALECFKQKNYKVFLKIVLPGLALVGGGQNLVGSGQSGPWALDTGLISC